MTAPKSKLYDRQPTDTDKSWSAFCMYRNMGRDRSLEKYRQRYAENRPANYINILKLWSAKHKWVERCRAYDADELQKESILLQEKRLERRLKLEQDAWDRRDKLIKKGDTLLAMPIAKPIKGEDGTTIYMPTDKWRISDAVAFYKYADELGIFATGGDRPNMTEIDAVKVLAQAGLLPAEILEAAERGSDALRSLLTEAFQNLKKPVSDS
jgi:hypothetical protein